MEDLKLLNKNKKQPMTPEEMCVLIQQFLEDKKAEDIVTLNLVGKSSITDYMIIATGQSARQVGAMAEGLALELKSKGISSTLEGIPQCDWVLIDAFDVIVHLFRPDVRKFYNLEKMWSMDLPQSTSS